MDFHDLAPWLVRLVPVGDGSGRLTMGLPFGQTAINFLGLGLALPVFWRVLDKSGHANTAERLALMERLLAVFGAAKIAARLAECEVVGQDWFSWLQEHRLPFHQRLNRDSLTPNRHNPMRRLGNRLGWLALAFAWTDRTGVWLHEPQPIRLKKPSSGHSSPCFAMDSTSSATSP